MYYLTKNIYHEGNNARRHKQKPANFPEYFYQFWKFQLRMPGSQVVVVRLKKIVAVVVVVEEEVVVVALVVVVVVVVVVV